MTKKIIPVAILMLFPLGIVSWGTSITVALERNFYTISADGLITNANSGNRISCKIVIDGKGTTSVVGAGLYRLPNTTYDLYSSAEQILKRAHSLDEVIQELIASVKRDLSKAIPKTYYTDHNRRYIDWPMAESITDVIASTMVEGQARAVKIMFFKGKFVEGAREIPLSADVQPVAVQDADLGEESIGDGAPTWPEIHLFRFNGFTYGSDDDKMSIVRGVRAVISEKKERKPQTVGGPISTLWVDNNGIHWVDFGACQKYDLQSHADQAWIGNLWYLIPGVAVISAVAWLSWLAWLSWRQRFGRRSMEPRPIRNTKRK